MLPAGKFFRKIIAISPDLVYTGRCIGHPSLRRKQVSSPPVQPHPAASRRGRRNCLPRLFLLFFHSAGIRIFSVVIAPYFRSPGAAIISALASFRCRSYAGIFSFSESIAVRSLEVFSLPVFRFWISERAAFIPLGFCAVVFSVYIRRFCPVTAPFSDLGASRFLSSFCPALDTFLSSRRWCLPY